MMNFYFVLLILFSLCITTTENFAQKNNSDSLLITRAFAKADKLYDASIKEQSHLFNGSQYLDYDPIDAEHPYFLTNDWSSGSVTYEDERYNNVFILYDIWRDALVVEHINGAMIDLVKPKVSSFEFSQHKFRRYTPADDKRNGISEGFYEILYEGKTSLLSRHQKVISESIQSMQLTREFIEKAQFYVIINNVFYQVSSKRSVMQLFSNKKQELKRFIRENKIKFRDNRSASLSRVVEFYDTLNP